MNNGEQMTAERQFLEPKRFAAIALANIVRQYPNKLDHVIDGPADICTPKELHPVFYGSYDWHSSVHMHWLLARLLRLYPNLPESQQIQETFNRHFTTLNIAQEISYLHRPSSRTFERTYGWSWLLKLQSELALLAKVNDNAKIWQDSIEPLTSVFVERYLQFLPLTQFPIRAGTHANSAFGMLFALDYAENSQHIVLRDAISQKANAWFGHDHRYPATYEPGGDDFLSGGLIEAALMLRVVDAGSYAEWWQSFCPAQEGLHAWLRPVAGTDQEDPKLAHLDGLNLSRAWCWKMLKNQLPISLHASVNAAIKTHIETSLPHALKGNYAGTHWLASFALLALTET